MSHSSSRSSSSSSSSSSISPAKSQFSSNPTESLKFGQKFKPGPIKVTHPPRRETESGLSSIDSRPSIRQKPKNSEFSLDLPKKPNSGQHPFKKLPSMKYTKNERSSSDSLSSDSFSSSVSRPKSPQRDPPKKILEAKPINMDPEPEVQKVFKPVLTSVDLDDTPNILIKPSEQPIKPSVPHFPNSKAEKAKIEMDPKEVNKDFIVRQEPEVFKVPQQPLSSIESPRIMVKPSEKPNFSIPPLPVNKIEGFKVEQNPKDVKNFEIDSSDVDKLDSSSEKSSESGKKIVKIRGNEANKVMKSSKSFSGSSGTSNPDASPDQFSDDLFAPRPKIAIKFEEAKNKLNSERHQIRIDSEENQNIEIPIGYPPPNTDKFLFSANYYSFDQLLKHFEEMSFNGKDFFEPKSCWFNLCKCFSKDTDLTPIQKTNLAKLDDLAIKSYNNDNEFHRDTLFGFYCRLTGRQIVQLDNQVLNLLGLSNFDYRRNELSHSYPLVVALHLIYIFEKKPVHLRTFYQARKPEQMTSFKLLVILMKESFTLLKTRKLNSLFTETSDVIPLFFQFHTGLILIWSEIAATTQELATSVRAAVDKASKSPALCVEIYNSK